ncbi:membrane protein insertion efficiency factor YidD [Paenibacillus sp. RC67]|uniref:membrane protein insertion efficiency factor YidD n=1 Tax=Paenibacillus sp. RC67 TaxID=3039392 RepID=UPI0024AE70CA|nr:membrane protein insertion efficiency factor YidD [Paenibacillus sp. RC67]
MKDSKTKETVFENFPSEEDFLKILHAGYGEDDPRSIFYKRTHVIPEINWRQALYHVLYPLLFGILISIIVFYILVPIISEYALWIACTVSLTEIFLYTLIRAKAILIWGIKVYQHFAPIELRNKCRFEPSCSMYMIQAIEKYGALRGVFQGIKRLRRCNISNGGHDYV